MDLLEQAKQAAFSPEALLHKENESLRAATEALRAKNAKLREHAQNVPTPQGALSLNLFAQLVKDKGIYFGLWEPKDRENKSLGYIYNVFAAPTDLDPPDPSGKNCRTFVDAVREVGARQNWHGHDGIHLTSDAALYTALKNGSAVGKWFIPTLDLLVGQSVDKKAVRELNLHSLRYVGAFDNTFHTYVTQDVRGNPFIYGSCSKFKDSPNYICGTSFINDVSVQTFTTNSERVSYRPCRVELAYTSEAYP